MNIHRVRHVFTILQSLSGGVIPQRVAVPHPRVVDNPLGTHFNHLSLHSALAWNVWQSGSRNFLEIDRRQRDPTKVGNTHLHL